MERIFAVATTTRSTAPAGRSTLVHFATAQQETVALNEDGFRVVAVAYKEIDTPKSAYSVADEVIE